MDERRRNQAILLLAFAAGMVLLLVMGKNERPGGEEETAAIAGPEWHGEDMAASGEALQAEPEPTENPEDGVYSFLQGPKSWKEGREWSGRWGTEYYDGGSFGGFGCGFCCMANIYSTLTGYKCTPLDIYEWTKKKTSYGGGGAVAWPFMRKAMSDIGFAVELGEKPSTYQAFQTEMERAGAMLVLVSSSNDDSYWKDTPGHYVTLFLYNSEMGEVFLTDSGDPKHNRHWVSLKLIYKALKTSSDFQYMSVLSYDEEKDTWKHTSAEGEWVKPAL